MMMDGKIKRNFHELRTNLLITKVTFTFSAAERAALSRFSRTPGSFVTFDIRS